MLPVLIMDTEDEPSFPPEISRMSTGKITSRVLFPSLLCAPSHGCCSKPPLHQSPQSQQETNLVLISELISHSSITEFQECCTCSWPTVNCQINIVPVLGYWWVTTLWASPCVYEESLRYVEKTFSINWPFKLKNFWIFSNDTSQNSTLNQVQ